MNEKNSKKGGPYTKPEQEERREKVFELYFEKGLSALQIAKVLNVNRNTINADIDECCYKMRSKEKDQYYSDWLVKQFTKLEYQKSRLQQELENDLSFKDRLQIEKNILKIDLSIATLVVKIDASKIIHVL